MFNLESIHTRNNVSAPIFQPPATVQDKRDRQPVLADDYNQVLDSEQERTWDEFYSGICMLYKHIDKANVDATQIIRSNLKLLHSNLLASAQYKNHVNSLKTKTSVNTLISRYPLISSRTLQGSFLRISKPSEEIQDTQLATHICYDYFNSSDYFHSVEPLISMYFIIDGKLSIDYSNKLNALTSGGNGNRSSITTRYFKNGDVIINPQYQSDLFNINNLKKDSLLLAIHVAHAEV